MAFGISGIIEVRKDKTVMVTKKRSDFLISPTWIGNIVFNTNRDCAPILNGKDTVHDYILRMYSEKKIIITQIKGFVSNGKSVAIDSLYPGFDEYYVLFIKSGMKLFLLSVGSKTVQEFRECGHDNHLRSRVPLTITTRTSDDGRESFVPINLFPFIREDSH